MGDIREPDRLFLTTLARTAQAHDFALAVASTDKTVRSSSKDRTYLESELHRALKGGRSHEVHRLTQLLGGKEIGVSNRLHLPGPRPEQEETKTHVTMHGVRGRMDAEVVDNRENGARIPAGHAAPQAAGHARGGKSENDPFQNSHGADKRTQQDRGTLERTHSSSLCVPRLRTCRWVRGDWKASVWKQLRNQKRSVHAQKKKLVSVLVHAQRAFHTPCIAHHSNGNLVYKRDGQKGMLGTRIIDVLCPLWKSRFAAMVRETVSEGGDEHFSPNWHGFSRREERSMDGAKVTKRSGVPSGTRWRVHLYGETWIAHGDVGGAYIFMVLR